MLIVEIFCWMALFLLPLYGLRGKSSTLLLWSLLVVVAAITVSLFPTFWPTFYADNPSRGGIIQFVGFLSLFVAAFPLGVYLTRFLHVSFEPMDWLPGFFLGLMLALLSIHYSLAFMLNVYPDPPKRDAVKRMFLVRQVVFLEGWHKLNNYVTTIGTPKDESFEEQ